MEVRKATGRYLQRRSQTPSEEGSGFAYQHHEHLTLTQTFFFYMEVRELRSVVQGGKRPHVYINLQTDKPVRHLGEGDQEVDHRKTPENYSLEPGYPERTILLSIVLLLVPLTFEYRGVHC